MKKNILLTGISGFLGYYLHKNKAENYQIKATHFQNKAPRDIDSISCDFQNETALLEMLQQFKPSGIIHSAAVSNPAYCEANPVLSNKINVQASVLLAKYAADENIPFVFTSTDMVFDGKKGNYKETDKPKPLNIYGQQKLRAEEEIAEIYPNAAICRMPLMLGNNPAFPEKYVQQLLAKAAKKESIPLFTDEYRSPLGVDSAAKALWLALEKMQGLFHLAGPDRLSRWELGLIIAEKFGLDKNLLKAGKQADLKLKAPRPQDVSMDSSKAAKLGFFPPAIEKDLN